MIKMLVDDLIILGPQKAWQPYSRDICNIPPASLGHRKYHNLWAQSSPIPLPAAGI